METLAATLADQTVAGASYERFWRLCQAACRAQEDKDKIGGGGYAHILQVSVQRAVHYDMDTLLRITREARETVPAEGPVDFWRDGYVAGCDKVISLLQGGLL